MREQAACTGCSRRNRECAPRSASNAWVHDTPRTSATAKPMRTPWMRPPASRFGRSTWRITPRPESRARPRCSKGACTCRCRRAKKARALTGTIRAAHFAAAWSRWMPRRASKSGRPTPSPQSPSPPGRTPTVCSDSVPRAAEFGIRRRSIRRATRSTSARAMPTRHRCPTPRMRFLPWT